MRNVGDKFKTKVVNQQLVSKVSRTPKTSKASRCIDNGSLEASSTHEGRMRLGDSVAIVRVPHGNRLPTTGQVHSGHESSVGLAEPDDRNRNRSLWAHDTRHTAGPSDGSLDQVPHRGLWYRIRGL